MPDHQKKIIISDFRKGVLSMIGTFLNKNARKEIDQYLITNKISISQSCVISKDLRDRVMTAVFGLVSIVLFVVSTKFGNAWVSIPFFTFLTCFPIIGLVLSLIIPRGRETTYFRKGERGYNIKPEYAKDFKKQFPDSYSKLSSSQQEIINNYFAKKSLRKKIPFFVFVYRNWTIILLLFFLLLMILAMNDWI